MYNLLPLFLSLDIPYVLYPGSGVVLDCIDSLSLQPYLLMPIFIWDCVAFFLHIYTICGFYVYVSYSFFFRRPQPNCLPVTHTLINEQNVMLIYNARGVGSAIKRGQIFAWLKDKNMIYIYSKKLIQ